MSLMIGVSIRIQNMKRNCKAICPMIRYEHPRPRSSELILQKPRKGHTETMRENLSNAEGSFKGVGDPEHSVVQNKDNRR